MNADDVKAYRVSHRQLPRVVPVEPLPFAGGDCGKHDPVLWFPTKGGPNSAAVAICNGCPVKDACLEYALPRAELAGVWGGMSETHRRMLRSALGRRSAATPHPCGTRAAHARHLSKGEDPCADCVEAERTYQREAKRRQRARAA